MHGQLRTFELFASESAIGVEATQRGGVRVEHRGRQSECGQQSVTGAIDPGQLEAYVQVPEGIDFLRADSGVVELLHRVGYPLRSSRECRAGSVGEVRNFTGTERVTHDCVGSWMESPAQDHGLPRSSERDVIVRMAQRLGSSQSTSSSGAGLRPR